MKDFEVRTIPREDTKEFILHLHYAQRMPPISYAFGLYKEGGLVGVCTFGQPASRPLCVGLLGEEHADKVLELNRLVVKEGLPDNCLSWFLSRALRALNRKPLAVVSFADEGAGHQGYIYQATNFIYTGVSPGRTDKYMPGNRHPRHYTEEYSHLRKVRTPKHRYVWFSRAGRGLRRHLKYPEMEYPKGENRRYELGSRIKTKIINTETGEEFYE